MLFIADAVLGDLSIFITDHHAGRREKVATAKLTIGNAVHVAALRVSDSNR